MHQKGYNGVRVIHKQFNEKKLYHLPTPPTELKNDVKNKRMNKFIAAK